MANFTLPSPLEFHNDQQSTTFEIPLTRNCIAIVDAIDADIAMFTWHADLSRDTAYAARTVYGSEGQRQTLRLHRVIMSRILKRELLRTEKVDHIDLNGLNCCRSNLRLATNAENCRNQKRRVTNTSGYKGVSWYEPLNKWMAKITFNRKQIYLGYFNDPLQAYEAYCEKAKELFGQFTRLV